MKRSAIPVTSKGIIVILLSNSEPCSSGESSLQLPEESCCTWLLWKTNEKFTITTSNLKSSSTFQSNYLFPCVLLIVAAPYFLLSFFIACAPSIPWCGSTTLNFVWLSNLNNPIVSHTDGDWVNAQQLFIAWDWKRTTGQKVSPSTGSHNF